jgi:tetratricopeptide (TPR) repeat protein
LPAVAALLGLDPDAAATALQNLERLCLVQQHVPARYRMHDLVRLYARELAQHRLPEAEQDAATRRVIDFYLHTAYTADRVLDRERPAIDLDALAPGSRPVPCDNRPQALAWLTAEHHCLLAAQGTADEHGRHRVVWELAWSLATFHHWRGHLQDGPATWQRALSAAEHLGDPERLAVAHHCLGRACTQATRHAEGIDHLRRALQLAEDTGDLAAQTDTLCVLAWAWDRQDNAAEALDHAARALTISQGIGDPLREARAHNAVGWYQARLGHHDTAQLHCQTALARFRQNDNIAGEAQTLDSLGYIAHHRGDHALAQQCYLEALHLFRRTGNTYAEAGSLERLGRTLAALEKHTAARQTWQHTLRLYETLHLAIDARRVENQLATLPE